MRVVYAETSEGQFVPCSSSWDGNILVRWIKASGFDFFDEEDPTFNGGGLVVRAKRGEGCLMAVPDQWYFHGFVATKFNSTHCHLNSTLRDSSAGYGASCDSSTAGTSIWKKMWSDDRQFFRQDSN